MSTNILIEEKIIDRNLVEINLIGQIEQSIAKKFLEIDIYKIINFHGYKPHLECISKGSEANILLLPIGLDKKFIPVYSGKLFEYLRLRKPILAISPKESEIEKLLEDTKSGINIHDKDVNKIKKFLLKYYNEWLAREDSFNPDFDKIMQFERRHLTEKLANIFDELIKCCNNE